MAWRIVKQPNGLFARFSDVVDNFTHMQMTQEQALGVCREHMSESEAQNKVQAGVEDHIPWTVGVKGKGTSRWEDALDSIKAVHGKKAMLKAYNKAKA
jgi:hypothetical protein